MKKIPKFGNLAQNSGDKYCFCLDAQAGIVTAV